MTTFLEADMELIRLADAPGLHVSSCPSCTCSKHEWIRMDYSDRKPHFRANVPADLAVVIVYWLLDHEYDRGSTLPWSLPNSISGSLEIVIEKHASAIHPGWRHKTISMDDAQREALFQELLERIKRYDEMIKGR